MESNTKNFFIDKKTTHHQQHQKIDIYSVHKLIKLKFRFIHPRVFEDTLIIESTFRVSG